jgi:hypothetical protein
MRQGSGQHRGSEEGDGGTGAYACAPPPSAHPTPPAAPVREGRIQRREPRKLAQLRRDRPDQLVLVEVAEGGAAREWATQRVRSRGRRHRGLRVRTATIGAPSPPRCTGPQGLLHSKERRYVAQLRRDRPRQLGGKIVEVPAGGAAREWATQMVRRMAAAPGPTRAHRHHRRTRRPPLHLSARGAWDAPVRRGGGGVFIVQCFRAQCIMGRNRKHAVAMLNILCVCARARVCVCVCGWGWGGGRNIGEGLMFREGAA